MRQAIREKRRAERKAEKKEARRLERKAARREARHAERQAQKEAKREAQWDEALAKARAAKLAADPRPPSEREDSPSGRQPFAVYRSSGSGLPPLRTYLHQLRKRRGLIWHLARSELKGENYNTFFGQLWIILGPLMLAGVYVLGRSVIRPIGTVGERNFLIAHLVGAVFLFQFTAKSMNSGSRSIIRNKNMLMNTQLPASVFPLASAVRSLFDLLPLMLTLFALRIVLDQPTTWVYIFLPLIIGVQLVFNLGLMFGTATLMVFFRDFGNILNFVSRLWLWTTPVLYTTQEIPESVKGVLQWNPLYPMFAMYEQVFAGEIPSIGYLLWALAWAVPLFVVSVAVFLRKERDFAVRL
jgi:teichoic acid transport system permease protein